MDIRVNKTKISLINTGSASKYLPIPPHIPAIILSFLQRYSFFVMIKPMSPARFELATPAFLSEMLEIASLTKRTLIRAVLYQAKLWAHLMKTQ